MGGNFSGWQISKGIHSLRGEKNVKFVTRLIFTFIINLYYFWNRRNKNNEQRISKMLRIRGQPTVYAPKGIKSLNKLLAAQASVPGTRRTTRTK